MQMIQRWLLAGGLGMTAAVGACGRTGADAGTASEGQTSAGAPASASGPAQLTPDAGGKVITVEMITDGNGSYFKPADFAARKGDVIRYTLGAGVHNVHFLPDSNAVKDGLPPASDMLQLPGQTHDVKVSFAPGTYYFQCDPHAALGMKGHVQVAP